MFHTIILLFSSTRSHRCRLPWTKSNLKWDQEILTWPLIELTSLLTEIKVCSKNIRNILKISLRESVLSAEPTFKTSLLCFNKSITKTLSSNRFSLEMDLSTQGLFISPRVAKTECQRPRFKEVTLRWDPRVGMKATSEALISWCHKENSTTQWLNNSSQSISLPTQPICPIFRRLSSKTLVSTSINSISLRCLCLYWLRLKVSWVLHHQPTVTSHPKLHRSRLKLSKTVMRWTKTSES